MNIKTQRQMQSGFASPRNASASRATSTVLSVRLSPDQRALLKAAAQHARTNLSDFVRSKAIEAAEAELLERRVVTIPPEQWEKVEAWVEAPAKAVPAFRKLSAIRPAWQD